MATKMERTSKLKKISKIKMTSKMKRTFKMKAASKMKMKQAGAELCQAQIPLKLKLVLGLD